MDFEALVDSSVEVIAEVEKIVRSKHSNSEMILLKDIYVNGEYFRDHSWTKMTKRLSVLSVGDKFTASATPKKYFNLETNKEDKIDFRTFRNVRKFTAEN